MDGTYKNIIKTIDDLLSKSGKSYFNEFYIGITDNPRRRLFEEHGVSEKNSWWLYIEAIDSETARNVEKHYLEKGMRGGTGGGNRESHFVYCYTVTPTTVDR